MEGGMALTFFFLDQRTIENVYCIVLAQITLHSSFYRIMTAVLETVDDTKTTVFTGENVCFRRI